MPVVIHHRPIVRTRGRTPQANPDLTAVAVIGMHGMGDNLHQRAIVRQLLERYTVVHLETPWPAIYHDLVGPQLRLVPATTGLRTQRKNISRETGRFTGTALPRGTTRLKVWYTGEQVRQHGSILAAMMAETGCDVQRADFRLPVADEWRRRIDEFLVKHGYDGRKPLLVYRPLVERTEWGGCAGRNPDAQAYWRIFQEIHDDYYVVSVADLVPAVEWISGVPVRVDLECHKGELVFELLAALFERAAMVYCSAGFAPLLAQAVGTPLVCIFGGHESSMTIRHGMHQAPTCAIDPIVPCNCFNHHHAHNKEIDVMAAIQKVNLFRCQFT